jgi:peptide/nickel transport system substrate-binding protein
VGGDTTATYAIETGDNCDIGKSTGYTGWDIAMWDWIGYPDPDAMLSYVTKTQWCAWADAGYDNPAYDKLYLEQGTTIDPEKRKQIVWKMQQMVYDDFVYTQLVNEQKIDAHSKAWTGFYPEMATGYSKLYYTSPHQVG